MLPDPMPGQQWGGASPIPTTLPWGQHRCLPQGTEVATKDQRSLAEGHFGDPKLQNLGSRRAHGDAEYMRQGSGALFHLAMAADIEGAHTLHAVSPNSMTSLMRSSCCAAWQDSKCATHPTMGAASQPHPTLTPSQRPASKLHLWMNWRVKFAAHGFGGTCSSHSTEWVLLRGQGLVGMQSDA